MHVLFVLQTAFSLWMLVDAVKRGAPQYWWLIILVPFGEWAYFFAVKLPNARFTAQVQRVTRSLLTRPASLAQLRFDLEQSPTHANRVVLAQALHDRGHFREASDLFVDVIDAAPDDKEALYGYARCCREEGDVRDATLALERLLALGLDYADFAPCYELAELYSESQREADAIALLERACKGSQRVGPRARLAKYLVAAGRGDQARELLSSGLRTYDASPAFVRRRDRTEAGQARRILRGL